MRSSWLAGLAAIGLCALAGNFASGLSAEVHPLAGAVGLEENETSATVTMLGQFRTSVAAWLWLRTDLYLHNGVEMRPMTDAEEHGGREAQGAADDGEKQLVNESTIVTVVPSAERDFRGIFGEIERAISAYKDMRGHSHNDPLQALPLFRLMTWLDPQFVTGWTIGASVMAREKTHASALKAIDYLLEGLRENPGNVEILAGLGEIYASRAKDPEAAIGYLRQAVASPANSITERLFPDTRNPTPNTNSPISDSEREARRSAYRWLGLCYRKLGKAHELADAMIHGLHEFPDDLVMARLLSPPPLVLTKKGEQEWLEAVGKRASR